MPNIRKAELQDAEEISRLAIEFGYGASGLDMRNRLAELRDNGKHLIAVAAIEEPKLVGWVSAEVRLILESGKRADLVGLVVDPAARGRGIGRALVEAAERWAREMGLPRIVVKSNIERPESHGFYEAIGYARDKTQHSYRKELANT